jgi:hypothetical protein
MRLSGEKHSVIKLLTRVRSFRRQVSRTWNRNCFWKVWRPDPESNRASRICNPVRNRSAIRPHVERMRSLTDRIIARNDL